MSIPTDHEAPDRAAATLGPPADDMLLTPTMREINSLQRSDGCSTEQLQARLEELISRREPILHTMGGGGVDGFSVDQARRSSTFSELWEGYYLPTGTPAAVPPERRYVPGQAWRAPAAANCLAYGAQGSGYLFSRTRGRFSGTNDHCEAGLYITVSTHKGYGQVNRLRFDPEILWNVDASIDTPWDWARFTSGGIRTKASIWLVAYELNVATNRYEPLINNAAIRKQMFNISMTGSGYTTLGWTPHSGQFSPGSLSLECIVDRARTYLFGVVVQTMVLHNLKYDGPESEQPPEDLDVHGTIEVTAPAMWISHTVLVP